MTERGPTRIAFMVAVRLRVLAHAHDAIATYTLVFVPIKEVSEHSEPG